MDENTVIKVENLSKKFTRSIKRTMLYGSVDIAKSMLGISPQTSKLRKGEFWALNDISFELKKGEALGIIGINGSGKSTLLRLLTGIFPPDKGKITINGSIGSLIAVGAGFHPHMTGRENIYLNGTILGMSKSEIEKKFDQIVNFADIGAFIDAPVSTYSSGMRVRLGFAIAIHSEPDILLIDEILSVGDLSFRNKSLRELNRIKSSAKGVIFVSHDIDQILNLCNRVIVLMEGSVVFDGPTQEGVIKYYEITNNIKYQSFDNEITSKKMGVVGEHKTTGDVEVLDIGIEDINENKINKIKFGEDVNVFCKIKLNRRIAKPYFSISIRDDRNFDLILQNNIDRNILTDNLDEGTYKLSVKLHSPNLIPNNTYLVGFGMKDARTLEYFEKYAIKGDNVFVIEGEEIPRGVIHLESKWSLNKLA